MSVLVVSAQDFSARVVGITDGDTITVLADRQQIKIRLFGVDCPEGGQAFGTRAKHLASQLAFGKAVTVEPVDIDRYGRTVARIIVPDGKELGHELVRAGLAWWYRQYAPEDFELMRLEEAARGAKIGLWADHNAIPPWEWRRPGLAAQPAVAAEEGVIYHGNVRSHVFHKPDCQAYDCTNCKAAFQSRATAIAAGYKPCGSCKP